MVKTKHMSQSINQHIEEHISYLSKLNETGLIAIEEAASMVSECFLAGGKLYICGGGTSYALAQYAESVFMNKCHIARPPLPAVALSANYALAPDNLNEIFEKQVTAIMTPADILMSFFSESLPESVVRAQRAAAQIKAKSIGFSGKDSGTLHGLCDLVLSIEHNDPLVVVEMHILMINVICSRVDEIIFAP